MKYLLSVLLVLLAPAGLALGLGEATLHSKLNEPLLVRVPILGAQGITKEELKAKIASPEVFERHKVERSHIHSMLLTRVVQSEAKDYVVEIYTRQPFKEAWVNFLVEVRWPKGNIVREVNALLDFPETQSPETDSSVTE